VVLSSQDGTNSSTTTASNGSFSFPVDSTKLVNASITIPMNQTSSSRLIVTNGTVYKLLRYCNQPATTIYSICSGPFKWYVHLSFCSGIWVSLPQLLVCYSTCLTAPDEFVTSILFTNALSQPQGMGLSCEATLCASVPTSGPATCVLPRLFFTHMVLCVISAGYAAACLCIACMFLTRILCDTYLMSHTVCCEFKYINLALCITAWHEFKPIEKVG